MARRRTAVLLLLLLLLQCLHASIAFHAILAPQSKRTLVPTTTVARKRWRFVTPVDWISDNTSTNKQVNRKWTTTTCLWSSSSPNDETSSDNSNNNNNKMNPLVIVVRKIVARFTLFWTTMNTRFSTLSRKAKMIVLSQLLILSLLLGAGTRQAIVSTTTSTPAVLQQQQRKKQPPMELPYSTFMDLCQGNEKRLLQGKIGNKNDPAIHIDNVNIGPSKIGYRISRIDTEEQRSALLRSQTTNKKKTTAAAETIIEIPQRAAYTRKVQASPELISFLRNNKIPFQAASQKGTNMVSVTLRSLVGVFYVLVMLRMYRAMSGGGGDGGIPGKLARRRGFRGKNNDLPLAKFEDIEGIDDAKFEVMELVDTLRNPQKYAILGARAPTGLLLEGPPGTGKTMLARATAATAGVPLLYCSGSDFVEMFVGRGAARVRKTFARAAKLSPCIVFIDELDALGKSRDSGMLGGSLRSNDEAEQTLNQLLACMDGLDSSRGVCVLAATNRRDVLDPALTRPGRFDRIITVRLPNTKGRERILRVHAKKLPGFKEGRGVDEKRMGSLGKGRAVDLSAVAAVTQGLSGAELEFIVNEAAIRAVRRVSAQLQQGADPNKIVPTVEAIDFEASVANYYETRRPGGGRGMSELISNVLRK